MSFRRVFVSCALIAFATASARVAALADTESQYYANLEAFQTTNASRGLQCQDMVRTVNQLSAYPQMGTQSMIDVFAIESSMCLYAVRRETRDKLPAVIPLQFKTLACKRALAYPKPDTGPVNYCSLKYEKLFEGL